MCYIVGAVKITPAHDSFDFELAAKHGLPNERVAILTDGTMAQICPNEFKVEFLLFKFINFIA